MSATQRIFQLDEAIRYVALYQAGKLSLNQRDNINNASESESDKYEELLVNPTLLTLAKQRGEIDCGGASFIIVGYGNFLQLIIDLPDGHASICFEKDANPIAFVQRIAEILT